LSSHPPDRPLPDDLREALENAGPRLGRFAGPIHYFDSIGSSNDVALRLADAGAPEGTVIVAGAQTAGRGRRGRDWFSPPGAGLYVSLILRPPAEVSAAMTLMAGVALADAIRIGTGLAARIKWPNDLLVDNLKLAGILAEGGGSTYVVLGFGVNLTRAAYPPAIANRATSIEHELGRAPDRGVVLAEALASFSARYADLVGGRFDAILGRWRELSPSSHGAAVEWMTPAGPVRGTTAGIDDRGALLVRVGPRIETIVGGEITWL
jgi:BirA family transcriptional regulator, biotin operon repressor / biotin---[acetyl-CoA-carboxylase] ligase